LKLNETRSFISSKTSEESVHYGRGTLFLTGSGEKSEEIGKCVVYLGDNQIWVGGDIIVLEPYQKFNPLFLSYLINSECIRIQREISSKGEIIVHIYSKNFREMKYPIPPLSEQHQIVSYLDEHTQLIDKTISVEQRRIDTLKEYRQSLISEVVTGKRKVTTDE
jgi:type I restriction enzyme S subunit